jgi:hypothetical protein
MLVINHKKTESILGAFKNVHDSLEGLLSRNPKTMFLYPQESWETIIS